MESYRPMLLQVREAGAEPGVGCLKGRSAPWLLSLLQPDGSIHGKVLQVGADDGAMVC